MAEVTLQLALFSSSCRCEAPRAARAPEPPCTRRCGNSCLATPASPARFWSRWIYRSAWTTVTLRKTDASWAQSDLSSLPHPKLPICFSGTSRTVRSLWLFLTWTFRHWRNSTRRKKSREAGQEVWCLFGLRISDQADPTNAGPRPQ